jgi:lysophospholipase L1-like esterase
MTTLAIGCAPGALAALRGGDAGVSPPPPPPPPTFDTIVIEGDSITRNVSHPEEAGSDTPDFFSTLWKATAAGKTVHIRAVNSRSVGTSANLDDNGNTLFGNVAEDLAYAPDLIAFMIGTNDFVAGTDAAYRTNLAALHAAYKAGDPSVMIAWSPPIAMNPTGTPHPAKANFDAQRASLMASARNPATWSAWADVYLPMGEYPDFADPALAAPLFGDSVHPSAAGHLLLQDSYAAAMNSLLDTARASSTAPYNAVWPASETNLATGTEIVRRFIVAGLGRTGTALGIAVSGAGATIRVNGGAYGTSFGTGSGNGHRLYNGDVVDLKLTTSASPDTPVSLDLTIGSETRTITYRTAAFVTPATYAHGDVIAAAGGASTASFAGLTFADGLAVIHLQANESAQSTSVTLNGNAMTLRHRQAGGGAIEVWEAPVAAGSGHAIAVTYGGYTAFRVLAYGTVRDGAFVSAAGSTPANQEQPHLTPSVTVPANGFALAAFREYGGPGMVPATTNAGTSFIDEGNVETFGEKAGLALGRRDTTGAASFNFAFGTYSRTILVYDAQ